MRNIKLNGKEYPCMMTMGALLRFKEMTGVNPSELDVNDVDLLIKLIYCCVKSACKREGVAFEFDLLDFADELDIESMSEVSKDLMGEAADAEDQKKTKIR